MKINWSKIKEVCPNAFASLLVYNELRNGEKLNFVEDKNILHLKDNEEIKYNPRDLYDFFFEKGLTIDVSWLPVENVFVWNVYSITNSEPLIQEEDPEANWEQYRYVAETYAFIKGFMILENIYNS